VGWRIRGGSFSSYRKNGRCEDCVTRRTDLPGDILDDKRRKGAVTGQKDKKKIAHKSTNPRLDEQRKRKRRERAYSKNCEIGNGVERKKTVLIKHKS